MSIGELVALLSLCLSCAITGYKLGKDAGSRKGSHKKKN